MNVNRPANSNGDPNAERIARMQALIERSSLGTDGARTLRNRTSRQTSDRIHRRLTELDLQTTLGAVVTEDLSSPQQTVHREALRASTYFMGDFGELWKNIKPAHKYGSLPRFARDIEPVFEPRIKSDNSYRELYSTHCVALAAWYRLSNETSLDTEMRVSHLLNNRPTGAWTNVGESLCELAALVLMEASVGVDFHSSWESAYRKISEASARMISMRSMSGTVPRSAPTVDRTLIDAATCGPLWLLLDDLGEFARPRDSTVHEGETRSLGRWIYGHRSARLRSSHTPITPDLSPLADGLGVHGGTQMRRAIGQERRSATGVNLYHRVSAILNANNIEHSKSILESSLSFRACKLRLEQGLILDVDLTFGDASKPVGSTLSRSTLNGLLTLMIKHWAPPESDRNSTSNDPEFRPNEILMITSRSERDGFLLSAFGAIEGAHQGDIDWPPVSNPKELRHIAEEFASELDGPDDDSGVTTTIVVVDGIDAESPLIRVDGYLTAEGHVG